MWSNTLPALLLIVAAGEYIHIKYLIADLRIVLIALLINVVFGEAILINSILFYIMIFVNGKASL